MKKKIELVSLGTKTKKGKRRKCFQQIEEKIGMIVLVSYNGDKYGTNNHLN